MLTKFVQLEWLTAIPWPNSTPLPGSNEAELTESKIRDKSFLTSARAQLDADHFGLEKIKKRLIEYLAVVRLKQINAEKEAAEECKRAEEATAAAAVAATESDSGEKAKIEAARQAVEDGRKVGTGKDVVLYDKTRVPQPLASVPPKRKTNKSVKGPILL